MLTDKEWQEFYQGDDGTMTMYVDGVKEEFAKNLGEDIEKKAEELKIKQENASLNVKVKISNTYNIEKINVAYTGTNMQEMIQFISSNYDTTKDKITLSRGG